MNELIAIKVKTFKGNIWMPEINIIYIGISQIIHIEEKKEYVGKYSHNSKPERTEVLYKLNGVQSRALHTKEKAKAIFKRINN